MFLSPTKCVSVIIRYAGTGKVPYLLVPSIADVLELLQTRARVYIYIYAAKIWRL